MNVDEQVKIVYSAFRVGSADAGSPRGMGDKLAAALSGFDAGTAQAIVDKFMRQTQSMSSAAFANCFGMPRLDAEKALGYAEKTIASSAGEKARATSEMVKDLPASRQEVGAASILLADTQAQLKPSVPFVQRFPAASEMTEALAESLVAHLLRDIDVAAIEPGGPFAVRATLASNEIGPAQAEAAMRLVLGPGFANVPVAAHAEIYSRREAEVGVAIVDGVVGGFDGVKDVHVNPAYDARGAVVTVRVTSAVSDASRDALQLALDQRLERAGARARVHITDQLV